MQTSAMIPLHEATFEARTTASMTVLVFNAKTDNPSDSFFSADRLIPRHDTLTPRFLSGSHRFPDRAETSEAPRMALADLRTLNAVFIAGEETPVARSREVQRRSASAGDEHPDVTTGSERICSGFPDISSTEMVKLSGLPLECENPLSR